MDEGHDGKERGHFKNEGEITCPLAMGMVATVAAMRKEAGLGTARGQNVKRELGWGTKGGTKGKTHFYSRVQARENRPADSCSVVER